MNLRDALQHRLGESFAVERELGGGGMSRVFLATDRALGRQVVVKLLPTELSAELSVERFKREIALAASLQHPHIVPVLSAGDVDGMPYFVMPYVEGQSLRQRLVQEGPLPVGEVVPILRDVARALAFAHSRGVVHRDVKPDNVLLAHGAAALTDFGVAKALSDAGATRGGGTAALTRVGTSLGTPDYMAPEQVAGEGAIDGRADLYAFGVMAYEILAGQPPFAGRSLPQVLAAHLAEPPPPLAERRPNVPAALINLVMRCLEKDPALRPQSAAEVVAALEGPSVTSGPVATGAIVAPRRSRRLLAIAGIVALIAAGGVAVGLRLSNGGPAPAAANGDRSIAVLPFGNLSGDTADLYFAAGMTEQLTGALAEVPGLRVASRTAALARAGDAADPRALGRALGVATLLEGTVRREGGRLRVSARLVGAADGLTLWSRTFEREASDVFAVQDSLTAAIVGAIRERFGGALAPAITRRGTLDLEAYDLYLRGRFLFERRGEDALRRAVAHFQDAVRRDSLYADAWAGLADAYGVLPLYAAVSADSVLPLALAAATRAVALDSTLATARASRGSLLNAAWRWEEAEADYRRAIALDPDYATAHQWLGEHLLVRGRVEEAVGSLRRAAALDSVSPIIAASYGAALGVAGDATAALRQARRALALDPALAAAQFFLGAVYLYAGDPAGAIAELEPGFGAGEGPVVGRGLLGYAYGVAGRARDARRLMATLDGTRSGTGDASAIARIYLGLGDTDSALAWLDRAAAARDPFFASESMAAPIFDPLRGDPRFAALVRRVGLGAVLTP
jgi:eukaryotic-like serine/threonine-protein kinase